MKRFLAGLVAGVILTAGSVAIANAPIRLVVNGQEVSFPDAPPQMINGRVMVPARPLAEALEADVKWDAVTQTVVVSRRIITVDPPPTYIRQDGKLWVERGNFFEVLVVRYGVGNVVYDGNKVGVAGARGAMYELEEYKVQGRVYYNIAPLVAAGIITEQAYTNRDTTSR